MARINLYYIVVLTIMLLVVLGIVALSVKSRLFKTYDEYQSSRPEDTESRRYAGLSNRNLSCFFNASMQVLFSLEEFRMFAENCNDERMPITRTIGNMFREMGNGEGYVRNMDHYNAILDSISSEEITPNQENCASQFLELLMDRVVEENMGAQGISEQDLSNMSFDNFEMIRQRMEMVRLFGFLMLPTGYAGYTMNYSPTRANYINIPLQVAWYIRSKTRGDMQRTVDDIVRGDPNCTPTRLVVHNGQVCKYLVLNFGSDGLSVGNIKWNDNEEVQVSGLRFSLAAMNLFRGNVKRSLRNRGGGHYMSCAKRGNTWYLFNDTSVEQTTLQSLQKSLTVTSAIFERVDVCRTV